MARLRVLIVLMVVWFIVLFNIERPDIFSFGNIDVASIVYVIAAINAVFVLLLPDLGKRWEFTLIMSSATYAVFRLLAPSTDLNLAIIITEITALVISALIVRSVSLAVVNFEQAVENVLLTPKGSRILPMATGEEEINNELFRARRFDRPVGFILVRITLVPGMHTRPSERFNLETIFQRRYLQVQVAQTVEAMVYRGDIIAWHNDNLIVCLPETNLEEAEKFAAQMNKLIRLRLNLNIPMAVAVFPDNGLIYRDLIDAALLNTHSFEDDDTGGPSLDQPTRTGPLDPNKLPDDDRQRGALALFSALRALFRSTFPTVTLDVNSPASTLKPDDPDFWVRSLPYQSNSSRSIYQLVKRLGETSLVLLSMPVVFPVMVLVGIAVVLDSGFPLFFAQERTGLGGKRFKMYKFRTMVPNAEEMLRELAAQGLAVLDENGKLAEPLKLKNDPRRTRVGRILRKTSLDELPQLINVLRGDMSIVGPRPTSWDLGSYTLLQTERLSVRPGITGLWQVYERGDTNFDNWLQWDMLYIDKMSFSLDFQIVVRTFTQVLKSRGAR